MTRALLPMDEMGGSICDIHTLLSVIDRDRSMYRFEEGLSLAK